jgi:hypothetical protein
MLTTRYLISVLLVVSLVSVSAGPVLAQESEVPSDEELERLLDEGVTLYNQNVDQLDLGFARGLIAGETVNVYIEDGDQTHVYSASFEDDLRISDVSTEPNSDASTRISTDRATLESIASSSDPLEAAEQAIRDDRIRITGERGHLVDQAVWTVVNLFKGLFI